MDEIKRSGFLYNNLLDIDNIKEAYRVVRSKCRNKRIILKFDLYRNLNLYNILLDLYYKRYKLGKYNIFIINEPKYRLIMSENIRDKVVNHLISSVILISALDKKLIYSNVATREGKGSGLANELIDKYLNSILLKHKIVYCLKMDIKKYFYNIDHDILKRMLDSDIKDRDALNIIFKVIHSTDEEYINKEINRVRYKEIERVKSLNISVKEKERKIKELLSIPLYIKGKGLGIGNMTSQILAVYYLSDLDHFIKEELRCKYYVRYMDDLIILDSDLDFLKFVYEKIKCKVNDYELVLNKKSGIHSLDRGFSFLGYTYKRCNGLIIRINNFTYRRVRKHLHNLKRFDSEMYERSIISYKGFFSRSGTKI